ncbi:hypothetical protein [Cupriavidus sp. AU9028]|uniref:hypothetical protein n=1 Tax=Cupriavidus sp. AU9028 TaxID=2871157 RepID=UPI001C95C441|nr:hypothetical protein [Cupriavidus sp. AU9028]MBY4898066.1 hypothetical protein [Cupriavidus sp. AU9028]
MEDEGLFGVALEGVRVVWVTEQLQSGCWTARYCWHKGEDAAAAQALQAAVLNGRSRRLPGLYASEDAARAAIREAVRMELRWGEGS